jgi:pyruvate formate lyase activating enzyme
MKDGKHVINRTKCNVCGKCAEKCYAQAIEIIGKETSVSEVIAEVMKDKAFYNNSGGGMTISGGEPMMQFKFTKALFKEAKKNGLHTCLDTCGFTKFENYEEILKDVDIFLYDLKDTDPVRHKEYTGVKLDLILENLQKLDDAGATIWLRCPIIPGVNADKEHMKSIAGITAKLKNLQEIDLMTYHPLGESKQERLGLEPKLNSKKFADRDECEKLRLLLETLCNVPVNMG